MDFKELDIHKVIIHKVIAKTQASPSYPDYADECHNLDIETQTTLKSRISSAVKKSKRFFETDIEQIHAGSFFAIANNLNYCNAEDFYTKSKSIADLAAVAHDNMKIPGGLLIIIDATIDSVSKATIVIKAEMQEALILKGTSVELMKELFLSPSHELYKIGILVHRDRNTFTQNAFQTYVFDDQFNSQSKDLAIYFYKDFLGFTTSKNDKLKTKNFLNAYTAFVDNHIQEPQTRIHLKQLIKADFRESESPLIDPSSYLTYFSTNDQAKEKFEKQVLSEYPISFSKNTTLLDASLQKTSINITSKMRLVGDSSEIDGKVEIINPKNDNARTQLITKINSGKLDKVITISTEADSGE